MFSALTMNLDPLKTPGSAATPILRDVLDPWRDTSIKCPPCGHVSAGKDLVHGDLHDTFFEMLCPHCNELAAMIVRPHVDELLAAREQLPEDVRAEVDNFAAACHQWHEAKLHREDQLPDLEADHIVLFWDEVGREILIRFGERVIYQGPGSWEYYGYFIDGCKVLRRKYGDRLYDVIPTERAFTSLWGDKLQSPQWTDEMRRRLRRASRIESWEGRMPPDPKGTWESYVPSPWD